MTVYHWLGIALSGLVLALLVAATFAVFHKRRRMNRPVQCGWLTDEMVRQIIEVGTLTERQVPEEALDLEEIAKEEERFWSEGWDEPDRYWD